MSTLLLQDPPVKSDIVEVLKTSLGPAYRMTKIFENYLRSRDQRLQDAAHVTNAVELSAQAATIAATALVTAAQGELYRIGYYIRQTVADGVSASILVTIRWTDGGINLSKGGVTLTANTTSAYDTAGAFMVRVDAGSNITYEVAATFGGGQGRYAIDVSAEQI